MPTYEYRCVNGHDFEDFVLKISAAKPELPCPTCGQRGERRVSAGGGLLFKGSGFYITDYGKDGKKSASAGKSDSAKSDAKKAESSSGASSAASESGASASSSTSSSSSASESKSAPSKASDTKSSGSSSSTKGDA